MSKQQPSVIEFCCGYGGASAGMLAAGLTIEKSYDLWPVAVEQHKAWHPQIPCEVRDVSTITPDELAGRFVWASLPCQPWSMANTNKDKRGKKHPHYYSLAHFARQVQHARCALIENVPGLVYSREGRAELLELERECFRLGLSMSIHLIYSHWFNVPQKRRRAFILIGRGLPLLLLQPGQLTTPLSSAVTCHDSGDNIHSSKKAALKAAVLASERKGRAGDFAAAGAGRTIEECAALQGVPVPSALLSKANRYTLVGNAVPPLLAQEIASQVFKPFREIGGIHE
jgi:site-specific DNA-cytosine methylase